MSFRPDPSPPAIHRDSLVSGGHSNRKAIERTRTGCRTCRNRKIKCDEKRPVCTQCYKGKRICEWQERADRRAKVFKRANSTACYSCREKKLRCIGDVREPCQKCIEMGIDCIRSQQYNEIAATSQSHTMPTPLKNPGVPGVLQSSTRSTELLALSSDALLSHGDAPSNHPSVIDQGEEAPFNLLTTNDSTSHTMVPEQLPRAKELKELVQLYFSSVHQFGFFSFIHEYNFNRLLAKGTAPRELTLMMIACAMRFASPKVNLSDIARADAWADAAINALLPRVYRGFGAIHLMALLLAQFYDFQRNHFSSAWLLGATCTRMMQMMSLQTIDCVHRKDMSAHSSLSPLLSPEALRRLAWSTFYFDTIIDGGRWGFHTVDESTFRLQLPCDQASFLANESVLTEPLFPNPSDSTRIIQADNGKERVSLDMTAYLLRTAAVRRRALHFAFYASYREQPEEELAAKLMTLENEVEQIIYALPKRFQFNPDNVFLHRDRLITFILLHILRHNLYIIIGRATLQLYRGNQDKEDLLRQARQHRISHALPIAGLVAEGLKADINFDPHIGIQAYVSLEILLFEPRRLAKDDPSLDPQTPEIIEAISYLLTAMRKIAARSECVKHLYIEALYRLERCDCVRLLEDVDVAALRSFQNEYHHLVGRETDEYDFCDFRAAKLERLHRAPWIAANAAHDEALLEDKSGGLDTSIAHCDSRASSPSSSRLDAMYIEKNPLLQASSSSSNTRERVDTPPSNIIDANESNNYGEFLTQDSESWSTLNELEMTGGALFPPDLFWPLDEFRNW